MRRLHPCLLVSQVQRLESAVSEDLAIAHISQGQEKRLDDPHHTISLGSKWTAKGADGVASAQPPASTTPPTPPTPATLSTPAPCLVLRVRESGGHFGSPDDQATELMEDYAFLLKHAHGGDAYGLP